MAGNPLETFQGKVIVGTTKSGEHESTKSAAKKIKPMPGKKGGKK